MLIFLFFVYLLGGSRGPTNLGHFYLTQAREYIGDEVKDPAREKEAKAAAKTAKKGLLKFVNQTNKSGKALKKLLEDYNSTPEQFDALIEESLAQQRQSAATVFEARQTMLESITAEEWSAILAGAQRENEADAKKAADKAARKAKKSTTVQDSIK
jgi:hypothetical protein